LRCQDLLDTYKPDLLYFDDNELPFEEYGLAIAAHMYNASIRDEGHLDAVVTGKGLRPDHVGAITLDIERGKAQGILDQPWQTDTCIGDWHYNIATFENHRYKTPKYVIHSLIDIVSKNGNLMLNIPVRGDGTIDSDEKAVLTRIGDWMSVNGEAIFATQPWAAFGEGPSMDAKNAAKGRFGGLADITKFSAQDVRYTQSKDGKTVFAFLMGAPRSNSVTLKSFGADAKLFSGTVGQVRLLGSNQTVKTGAAPQGLTLSFDAADPALANVAACVFAIELK
ncbi:MAG: alpha-L-fucosidase, partial [Tepidisphaeraceae bacterium]